MNEQTLKQAGRRLESWRRTMILTHERPDGDGLGAAGAMKRIIEKAGRHAAAFVFGETPARYAFLSKSCGLAAWKPEPPASLDGQFDGILILDTSSWSQLEPAAASTCSLVWQWCEVMGWQLDKAAAEALFTGLITDTGWFRFSNTDAATFQAAAALLKHGSRPEVLYARLYEFWSPARLGIMSHLLNSLRWHENNRMAVMSLPLKAFEATGATQADTEELVNEPMAVGSAVVSVLLSEMPGGKIRVNLRSKAPDVCGVDVDMAALAQSLGGGGHRRAAGARMAGPLEEVRGKVTEAAVAALRAAEDAAKS